jgi:periplasmic copper chaperone A
MLSPRKFRNAIRALVLLGGSAVALVVLAGTAFAHITVTPTTAVQGSRTELTFVVPNEESKASTIQVELKVPTDPPIGQFLVKPVPGWKISVQNVKLAKPVVTADGSFSTVVSFVTWSGGKILPGHYEEFPVVAGPLPSHVRQIVFKAIQTYSNGDVVRWIDLPQPGPLPPQHPAAILALTSKNTAANTATTASAASQAGPADGTTAIALGLVGLAAGALGLAAGGSAWLRERRRSRT